MRLTPIKPVFSKLRKYSFELKGDIRILIDQDPTVLRTVSNLYPLDISPLKTTPMTIRYKKYIYSLLYIVETLVTAYDSIKVQYIQKYKDTLTHIYATTGELMDLTGLLRIVSPQYPEFDTIVRNTVYNELVDISPDIRTHYIKIPEYSNDELFDAMRFVDISKPIMDNGLVMLNSMCVDVCENDVQIKHLTNLTNSNEMYFGHLGYAYIRGMMCYVTGLYRMMNQSNYPEILDEVEYLTKLSNIAVGGSYSIGWTIEFIKLNDEGLYRKILNILEKEVIVTGDEITMFTSRPNMQLIKDVENSSDRTRMSVHGIDGLVTGLNGFQTNVIELLPKDTEYYISRKWEDRLDDRWCCGSFKYRINPVKTLSLSTNKQIETKVNDYFNSQKPIDFNTITIDDEDIYKFLTHYCPMAKTIADLDTPKRPVSYYMDTYRTDTGYGDESYRWEYFEYDSWIYENALVYASDFNDDIMFMYDRANKDIIVHNLELLKKAVKLFKVGIDYDSLHDLPVNYTIARMKLFKLLTT